MIKILFFIGSLGSGGKERRFIELLSYLKANKRYEILVVTTSKEIHFPFFNSLNIPIKNFKKNKYLDNLTFPFEFYKVSKDFKPDIIHTWGRIQTSYVLLSKILNKTILINAQITNASPKISLPNRILDKINFLFSDLILSNSYAGIEAYNPPKKKTRVIYNGMNMNRFKNLPAPEVIKEKYKLYTKFTVIMVANFSENKDYDFFYKVANKVISIRSDVTFIGVGYFHINSDLYINCKKLINGNPRILISGLIFDVEALVNACDIGILISNANKHGEGISNSILEYMALRKPVIANDTGGTKEILKNGENGFLIKKETIEEVSEKISFLLNNPEMREKFGKKGKKLIDENFTLQKMGETFEKLYLDVLLSRQKNEKNENFN
jgi:glycosyltransferase involved in cell wall biosynthesis